MSLRERGFWYGWLRALRRGGWSMSPVGGRQSTSVKHGKNQDCFQSFDRKLGEKERERERHTLPVVEVELLLF